MAENQSDRGRPARNPGSGSQDAAETAALPDEALAQVLQQAGMVTFDEIEQARDIQKEQAQKGQLVSLGDVLIQQGVITPAILRNVGKKIKARQAGGIKQLGQYKLLRKLGEGGMGTVFLAEDTNVGRSVALKVLPHKLSEDREFLMRFRREAQSTGKLNHVNIVMAYTVAEDQGIHYYAMEYCDGEGLDQLLKRTKFLAWDLATGVTMQVARGLQHAHEHGIIHRDIKPANIFICRPPDIAADTASPMDLFAEGFVAKILDLGLSKDSGRASSSFYTQAGVAMGTPHYISPEQAKGHSEVDGRTDIYSLGATYYHLVTGETPFSGSTPATVMMKHLQEQLPNPQDVNGEIPDGVVHVIQRTMAKDPADRYQNCKELLDDLALVIDGKIPSSRAIDASKSSIAKARRRAQKEAGAGGRRRGTGRDAPVDGTALSKRRGTRRQEPVGTKSVRPVDRHSDRDASGEQDPSNRRPLILAAVGAGVLLLMVAAFLLITRGDESPVAKAKAKKPAEKSSTLPTVPPNKTAQKRLKPSKAPPVKPKKSVRAIWEELQKFKGLAANDKAGRIARLQAFLKKHGAADPIYAARARNELDKLQEKAPPPQPLPKPPVTAQVAPTPNPQPGKAVFLSDLSEKDVKVLVVGKLKRFGKNGRVPYGDGKIRLSGVTSPKGVFMHPPNRASSHVAYQLDDKYSIFLGKVGINDTSSHSSTPVVFRVMVDGKPVWASKPLQKKGANQDFKLDVSGGRLLQLMVDCPGRCSGAHAVWFEPRLIPKQQKVAVDPVEARRDHLELSKIPEFADFSAQLAKAETAGAKKLMDGRAFELIDGKGKRIAIGKGRKTRLLKADGGKLSIEQDIGGGKITVGLRIANLSARTRHDLAVLGLPPGPQSDLKLAFASIRRLESGEAEVALSEIGKLLDSAAKDNELADSVALLRKRLDGVKAELPALEAWRRAEALFERKAMHEAKTAYEDFQMVFGETKAGRSKAEILRQRLAAIDTAIAARHKVLRPSALLKGAVAIYTFDKTTIGRDGKQHLAKDLSGKRAPAKLIGGTLVPGIVGDGFDVAGKNTYVDLGIPNTPDPKTVCFWAKAKKAGAARQLLFGYIADPSANRFYVGFDNNGILGLGLGGSGWAKESRNVKLDVNWHHYGIVYDGTKMDLFFDGKHCGVKKGTHKAAGRYFLGTLLFGNKLHQDEFDGIVDEFIMFDRVLPPAEIAKVFEMGAEGKSLRR